MSAPLHNPRPEVAVANARAADLSFMVRSRAPWPEFFTRPVSSPETRSRSSGSPHMSTESNPSPDRPHGKSRL